MASPHTDWKRLRLHTWWWQSKLKYLFVASSSNFLLPTLEHLIAAVRMTQDLVSNEGGGLEEQEGNFPSFTLLIHLALLSSLIYLRLKQTREKSKTFVRQTLCCWRCFIFKLRIRHKCLEYFSASVDSIQTGHS